MGNFPEESATATPPGTTTGSYLAPLGHPLWWCALIVLLLNDHVLKGAGLLPGWMTGKLSDFAGLLVAPVLVAALIGATSNTARARAYALVVVPFVLVNTWERAAEIVTWATATLGVPWRLWSDPGDLVALCILPVAWWVSVRTPRRCPMPVLRFGAFAAALACVATSFPYEKVETSAYLVNTTHDSHVVHIYRSTEPIDCDAVSDAPESVLTADQFSFETCRKAEPFVIVPLDSDWRELEGSSDEPRSADGGYRACDAVVLRVRGMRDTAVLLYRLPKVRVNTSGYRVDVEDAEPQALYLEEFRGELFVESTTYLRAWEVDWDLPGQTVACGDAP
jgi:hypothetical protein